MNSLQQRIIKTEWRPNCFILMSPKIRDNKRPMDIDNMDYAMSFVFHNRVTHYAAEWEPRYGPIQTWHECSESDPGAHEHYFFDFTDSGGGNWSQTAVEREDLHTHFFNSAWGFIFNILASWADR